MLTGDKITKNLWKRLIRRWKIFVTPVNKSFTSSMVQKWIDEKWVNAKESGFMKPLGLQIIT